MSAPFQGDLDFEAARDAVDDGEALIIDIEGFEGPLDLLLELARSQKVDLMKLSITRLVDQYLGFVREARRRRFSLAADYLVMAAWLAFLKSRLMLPKTQREAVDGPPPEAVAQHLAWRLAKLDAMRKAAEALQQGAQFGRDVFGRGDPEQVKIVPSTRIEGDLYGLMQAYIGQWKKDHTRSYTPPTPQSYPLDEARERLKGLLHELKRWTPLQAVAPHGRAELGPSRASFVASTLSASLELVKDGELEARQLEAFADIYLRARPAKAA
jgi:segregation and condensation protein A